MNNFSFLQVSVISLADFFCFFSNGSTTRVYTDENCIFRANSDIFSKYTILNAINRIPFFTSNIYKTRSLHL